MYKRIAMNKRELEKILNGDIPRGTLNSIFKSAGIKEF